VPPISESPKEFECRVGQKLQELYPCCAILDVPVFNAIKERGGSSQNWTYSNQLDCVLHFRKGGKDILLVVDAKCLACKVTDMEKLLGKTFGNKTLSARIADQREAIEQKMWHCETLWLLVLPEGIVPTTLRGDNVIACSIDAMEEAIRSHLGTPPEFIQVMHSPLLGELAWGIPHDAWGHPGILDAIRTVRRGREAFDESLFSEFAPPAERWMINGTSGVGKTYFLAYALYVISSGSTLGGSKAEGFLQKVPRDKVHILVLGPHKKHIETIQRLYRKMLDKFPPMGSVIRPHYLTFEKAENDPTCLDSCTHILVDEAHDLGRHQKLSQALVKKCPQEKPSAYLLITCDRHQSFQTDDTAVIKGLDFSKPKSNRKLSRNYRNPVPIFWASISLLFRWFGVEPQVCPSQTDLQTILNVKNSHWPSREDGYEIVVDDDCHPGSNWENTVRLFEAPEEVYHLLKINRLTQEEVLWVRFSPEHKDFDYEQLLQFKYHDLSGDKTLATDAINKYIKGQEFPVVIIEGMPEHAHGSVDDGKSWDEATWDSRKQLYIVASRAGCFLWFLKPAINSDVDWKEFQSVIRHITLE